MSSRVWIMLSAAIMPGMKFHRVSRLGLNHARDSMRTGAWMPPCRCRHSSLKALTTELTKPAAEPAVLELRASMITWIGASSPALSCRSKSGPIWMTTSASCRLTSGAICSGDVSVAARLNTPVPSSLAMSAVDAPVRLWSSSA